MPQLTDKEDAARQHFLDQLTSDEERSVKQQAVMLLTHAARNRDVSAQLRSVLSGALLQWSVDAIKLKLEHLELCRSSNVPELQCCRKYDADGKCRWMHGLSLAPWRTWKA